jgi:LuxR family maltose regulon positive regulatory protein
MGIARQRLRSMAALLKGLSDAIPFDAMQIHLLISEVYEQLGDPSAAVIHANYAAGRLVTLGDAGVMADRLDALLARLSEQAPQALIEPEDVGSLTARERQILRLLSTSMSLREIGHELYVSRNTVKTHVSSIYRKLDVSSRTAAVARAQEMELI